MRKKCEHCGGKLFPDWVSQSEWFQSFSYSYLCTVCNEVTVVTMTNGPMSFAHKLKIAKRFMDQGFNQSQIRRIFGNTVGQKLCLILEIRKREPGFQIRSGDNFFTLTEYLNNL